MDELLRWLSEQHAAGVTVRGGKIRSHKTQMWGAESASGQPEKWNGKPSSDGRTAAVGTGARPASGRRVQISIPETQQRKAIDPGAAAGLNLDPGAATSD